MSVALRQRWWRLLLLIAVQAVLPAPLKSAVSRPAGLAKKRAPWKHLVGQLKGYNVTVNNSFPYVLRLGQQVKALPGDTDWMLPNSYLPLGQSLIMTSDKPAGVAYQVIISQATTWGYVVNSVDATLSH